MGGKADASGGRGECDGCAMTTIRAEVTRDEHDAVRHIARVKLGTTMDKLVREAVDEHMRRLTGKSLSELAAEACNRGKWVQGELWPADPR